jgi:hypothetical protein
MRVEKVLREKVLQDLLRRKGKSGTESEISRNF